MSAMYLNRRKSRERLINYSNSIKYMFQFILTNAGKVNWNSVGRNGCRRGNGIATPKLKQSFIQSYSSTLHVVRTPYAHERASRRLADSWLRYVYRKRFSGNLRKEFSNEKIQNCVRASKNGKSHKCSQSLWGTFHVPPSITISFRISHSV